MVIQCPWLQPPRYSCHGTPKPVCWWHHQICHLPCRPCSISRWQLAQWEHLALRSLCVRYSWLPMSMFAPLSSTSASSPLPQPNYSNLYSKGSTASLLHSDLPLFLGCQQYFPLRFACTEQICSFILFSALLFCIWGASFELPHNLRTSFTH